jgi:DNA invertase Pin-like site-specific DNA recombinase
MALAYMLPGEFTSAAGTQLAQFELELLKERQKVGIAAERATGKYKGRKPTVRLQSDAIMALRDKGMGLAAIAGELGVSTTSVWRVLKGAETRDTAAV